VNDKMSKRTDPWQGKVLSSKLILVNSCLTSIPTYIMGFYRLTDDQHREMTLLGGNSTRREVVMYLNITWPNRRLFVTPHVTALLITFI
jgi:hypothetical protein